VRSEVERVNIVLSDGSPVADGFLQLHVLVHDNLRVGDVLVGLVPLGRGGAVVRVALGVSGVREVELDGGATTANEKVLGLRETSTAGLRASCVFAPVAVATVGVGVDLFLRQVRA